MIFQPLNDSEKIKNKSILLIEDDETFGLILKFRLENLGYEIIISKDGKEALHLIEHQNPDLIISDIMLPSITGFDILNYVRKTLNRTTPYIIISNDQQEQTKQKVLHFKANDFLKKPFNITELESKILNLL